MTKNLLVFCYGEQDGAKDAVKALHNTDICALGAADELDGLLRNVFDAVNLSSRGALPVEWGRQTIGMFESVVHGYLSDFCASVKNWAYVCSSFNSFYIENWRQACQNFGIVPRFVYIRNFPWQCSNSSASAVESFCTAAAVVRQHGTDILCYDNNDWVTHAKASQARLMRIVNGGGQVAMSAGARIAATVGADKNQNISLDQLPIELQALSHLYAGRHFGAPLFIEGREDSLATIEWSTSRASAIFELMRMRSEIKGSDVRAQPTNIRPPIPLGVRAETYRPLVQGVRGRLNEARAQLKEIEAKASGITARNAAVPARNPGTARAGGGAAVAKRPAAGKPAATAGGGGAAKSPSAGGKQGGGAASAGARASPSGLSEKKKAKVASPIEKNKTKSAFSRKWAKFRRDPALFFADAKNPVVRRLGGIIWH